MGFSFVLLFGQRASGELSNILSRLNRFPQGVSLFFNAKICILIVLGINLDI